MYEEDKAFWFGFFQIFSMLAVYLGMGILAIVNGRANAVYNKELLLFEHRTNEKVKKSLGKVKTDIIDSDNDSRINAIEINQDNLKKVEK